ncbi:uncharacterized protein LOC143208075 [Lasioglossum baleicum]|uniref:uncharacterized protein LOC143208075 n=1 Tax=Lasioglossum baleicum TaxID=434251 RepID=UPI003FCC3170
MWNKLVVLFLLFAIVAPNPVIERKCKVGQSYYDGCNTCFCANGAAIGCTLMACWVYDNVTKTSTMYKQLAPPESFWESQLVRV